MSETSLRAERREQNRQRFIDVALTIFGERGYEGVSIEQIAREAGASVGTIYLYFRSKEQLYLQAYNLPYTSVHEAILACLDGSATGEVRKTVVELVEKQKMASDIERARAKPPRKPRAPAATSPSVPEDVDGV